MPVQLQRIPSQPIEATYKAREVEGIVDLGFYRPLGYRLAQIFARLNFTPTAVTLVGGVFGIIAGHLYFYRSLAVNIAGLAFHALANVFDNADGQLARLTNQQTRTGRILDPLVDHLVWFSIYFHLALRLADGSAAIWVLAVAAGISHALQAAAADYWRNAYLYFAKGRREFDSAATIKEEYDRYDWSNDPWAKFLLLLYLNVAREQELVLPGVKKLHDRVKAAAVNEVPDWFRARYRADVVATFKCWGLLMTNTRMLILFVVFLLRQPTGFFWLELTAGNLLLFYLIRRQEKISGALTRLLARPSQSA